LRGQRVESLPLGTASDDGYVDCGIAQPADGAQEHVASFDGNQPPHPADDERIAGKTERAAGLGARQELGTTLPRVRDQVNPVRGNPNSSEFGDQRT